MKEKSKSGSWGGPWTEKKLEAFGKYVSVYLKILKRQPQWKTIYFDGFAGSGERKNADNEVQEIYKQCQTITNMGDGSLPFTEKAAEYARTNPEFLPPFVKVEEFATDFKAARMLKNLYQSLSQLVSRIDDSMLLSGSEAFLAARAYYATVKTASKANAAGAKVIAADLSERFAGQGKGAEPAPEPKA